MFSIESQKGWNMPEFGAFLQPAPKVKIHREMQLFVQATDELKELATEERGFLRDSYISGQHSTIEWWTTIDSDYVSLLVNVNPVAIN